MHPGGKINLVSIPTYRKSCIGYSGGRCYFWVFGASEHHIFDLAQCTQIARHLARLKKD